MRVLLLSFLLIGAVACSRHPAPVTGGSAMAPPPNDPAAQSVPAGAMPQPSPASAGTIASAAGTAKPPTGAAPVGAPRNDPRWVDVDPNQLGVPGDPALADFQAQQRQRDSELLQRDADEAGALRADGGREDARPDPRDARDLGEDEPIDEGRYGDPRDDGYGSPPELPPEDMDDGAYDEPPPYDEGDDPEPDEGYDPRYDSGNGRR